MVLRRHPIGPEKRELVRPFAVGLERFSPERFGLLVRAIRVTRRAGGIAAAASMNDHRIVPRAETLREIASFTCPDGIRNGSI